MGQMRTCECGCGEVPPISPRTHTRYGHVKGEPVRFVQGHQFKRKGPDYLVEDRGYATPCWIWQGATDSSGYGSLGIMGKMFSAHRFYFEKEHGEIPVGVQLDHLCRVIRCCNPEHLDPVSGTVNVRRGRATKLNEEQVIQIRRRCGSGEKQRIVAKDFGVVRTTVTAIMTRATWVDLELEVR